MGYIDVHAHIIPGMDDGPKTIEESIQMLQKAYEEGFTTVIATPHCSKGFRGYSSDDVIYHCNLLDQYAKQKLSSEFQVLPGQEVYYSEESLQLIRSEKIVPLAKSKYVLLEFETNIPYSQLLRGLREVSMSPYAVVLAHIERYACLQEFKNLKEIREMGVLTQMNYSDIGGKWYQPNTTWCRNCLKKGYVDFLGTDVHDAFTRTSKLTPALKWMQKKLDSNYIQNLVNLNAKKFLLIE